MGNHRKLTINGNADIVTWIAIGITIFLLSMAGGIWFLIYLMVYKCYCL